jgi:hypothetical protein
MLLIICIQVTSLISESRACYQMGYLHGDAIFYMEVADG